MFRVTGFGEHKRAQNELSPSMNTLLSGMESGAITEHPLIARAIELGLIVTY
jgi:hypothetical protein